MKRINTILAEKVMGWRLWNYEESRYANSDADYLDAEINDGWTWEGWGREEAWMWRPTSDVACAWEIVEKLSHRDPLILQWGESDGSWTWCVDFDGTNNSDEPVRHDEITMAICWAAMLAEGLLVP